MDFYINCLNPENARDKNKYIHDGITNFLKKNDIQCDSLTYRVEPLSKQWIEKALEEMDYTDDGDYICGEQTLTLNQAIDLIKEKCFRVHVRIYDMHVMKK